jgi:hypothetical protein
MTARLAGAMAIAIAAPLLHGRSATAQPRKPSVIELRQELEQLRGQLAYAHGRDSQHDGDLVQLARRVAELESRAVALEAGERVDDAAGTADPVIALRGELYAQVEALRAEIDALLDAPSPTQVDHEGGFVWTSEDETYQLRIGGHLQTRWSLARGGESMAIPTPAPGIPPAEDDIRDGGFALRRARVALDGTGGGELGFRVMAELVEPALVDGWLEYRDDTFGVRAGRDRIPFLRSGVMPEAQYAFAERAVVADAFGWDRDVGLQLRVHPERVPLRAVVMVANGGRDAADELDDDDAPMGALRVETTTVGRRPDPGAGDFRGDLSVTVGMNLAIGAARAPAELTGADGMPIAIDPDADGDGTADRVVTATTGVDLTMRIEGFELTAEGMWRIEGWGELLAHNPALADAVGLSPIDPQLPPQTRYFAGAIDATYVFDANLLVGARIGGGHLPFLSNDGPSAIPAGRTVLELDGTLGFYRNHTRLVGLTYRYLDYGERYRGGGDGPIEHLVIAEAQVVL